MAGKEVYRPVYPCILYFNLITLGLSLSAGPAQHSPGNAQTFCISTTLTRVSRAITSHRHRINFFKQQLTNRISHLASHAFFSVVLLHRLMKYQSLNVQWRCRHVWLILIPPVSDQMWGHYYDVTEGYLTLYIIIPNLGTGPGLI